MIVAFRSRKRMRLHGCSCDILTLDPVLFRIFRAAPFGCTYETFLRIFHAGRLSLVLQVDLEGDVLRQPQRVANLGNQVAHRFVADVVARQRAANEELVQSLARVMRVEPAHSVEHSLVADVVTIAIRELDGVAKPTSWNETLATVENVTRPIKSKKTKSFAGSITARASGRMIFAAACAGVGKWRLMAASMAGRSPVAAVMARFKMNLSLSTVCGMSASLDTITCKDESLTATGKMHNSRATASGTESSASISISRAAMS